MRKFLFKELDDATAIYEQGKFTKINFLNIYLLAKYLRFKKDSFGKTKIHNKVMEYINRTDPNYFKKDQAKKEVQIENAIEKAMRQARLENTEEVIITKSELRTLNRIKDLTTRRVAFVILVLARANQVRNRKDSDRLFLDEGYEAQIMDLCKIFKYRNSFYHNYIAKLVLIIEYWPVSKNYNIERPCYEIEFDDISDEVALRVTDFNNLLKYMPHICPKCNKEMEEKDPRRDECSACYRDIRKEKVRINVAALRARRKAL
jgi:hypothetical protein